MKSVKLTLLVMQLCFVTLKTSVAQEVNGVINGMVIYANHQHAPLPGVNVYLLDASGMAIDSAITIYNGTFCFNVAPGDYDIELKIRLPWIFGAANSYDALLVMKHFVNLDTLTGVHLLSADVNLSEGVNATDALLISQRFSGIIHSFPAGDWVWLSEPFTVYAGLATLVKVPALIAGDVNGSFIFSPPPCFPMPDPAYAGEDLLGQATDSVPLNANAPVHGTGSWCIIAGQDGQFSNTGLANTYFHGQPGMIYDLIWTIANACGSNQDTVTIGFLPLPSAANAGPDTLNIPIDSILLQANTPIYGNGTWHIVSGSGGYFSDSSNPNTGFFGQAGNFYELVWTITNLWGSNYDTIVVGFALFPDQAVAGPDTFNIPVDSISLQGNIPVNGAGSWSIASGSGGHFSDSSIAQAVFYGQPGIQYELVWSISTPWGISSDTVVVGFADTLQNCGIITDARDGQQYSTVRIGSQCWMARNLNIGVMVTDSVGQSNNGAVEKFCYNNNPAQCDDFGGLYNWDEMMGYTTQSGRQGICPDGWHIPTKGEWEVMVDFLGGAAIAGGHLKEAGTQHWMSPNLGASDSAGFTGLPGGVWYGAAGFTQVNETAGWWSSSQNESHEAFAIALTYNSTNVLSVPVNKFLGGAIRCVQGPQCEPQPDAANAGTDSLNFFGDTIILQGNTPGTGSGVWSVAYEGFRFDDEKGWLYDPYDPNTSFVGNPTDKYILTWTINNICGISSDTIEVSFSCDYHSCGTLTDARDGKQYETVRVGNRCWMAENLNIGVFTASIDSGTSYFGMSDNGIIEKYCYNNDLNNCSIYGGLYEWHELMGYLLTEGAQGICPDGWHVPTDGEWSDLLAFFGGSINGAYSRLKETGIIHWDSANLYSATNSSCFTALPGGFRNGENGAFRDLGSVAVFPTSRHDGNGFWYHLLSATGSGTRLLYNDIYYGYSLRCIQDVQATPPPEQADAGPDTFNILSQSITLQANIPSFGTGTWTVLSGGGDSIVNPHDANTLFIGAPGVVYALIWTINSTYGSSSDTVLIGFACDFTSCGLITDVRDGKQYPTVKLGSQCWMAANLNIGQFVMSDSVLMGIQHSDASDNALIEKYCYANIESNCQVYGGMYDWNELMAYDSVEGVQGICPSGWHLPTKDEWTQLVVFLGGEQTAGGKLKEAGLTHWRDPNTGAINSSCFSALPAGYRHKLGYFHFQTYYGLYWTSSKDTDIKSWFFGLSYDSIGIGNDTIDSPYGLSVRCIKDN